MESVVSRSNLANHSRSISFPSSSHPLVLSVEQKLDRLRSSENASSSSMHQKLDGLKNLYESLDDVLQLPLSQNAFSPERNGKWGEAVLDGSLWLLDICGNVRDIYSQMKRTIRELESSLRRKRSGELANGVDAYTIAKKRINKMICKSYKEFKKAEKNYTFAATGKELINPIKVQQVSLTMLESALSFISGPKSRSQPRGLFLVAKLLQSKGTSCEEQSENAGIQNMEADLLVLRNKKPNQEKNLLQMKNLLKQLEAWGNNIQELLEMLEVVFGLLLKTRVSLLNILHH